MGAWRLRACVYGMLAVVAGLVILQTRAQGDDPPVPRWLHGHTNMGGSVSASVQGRRILVFKIDSPIRACGSRTWFQWLPWRGRADAHWRQSGLRLRADRYADYGPWRIQSHLRASLGDGGDWLAGSAWYEAISGPRRCYSSMLNFSAHP